MLSILNTVLSLGLGAFITIVILLLKPAPKEDARRSALHELEVFCPPKWGRITIMEAREALSRLYKELQYAARGRSFLITRAAVWKMIEILNNYEIDSKINDTDEISSDASKKLYVWKTVIACALGRQRNIPIFPTSAQKNYRKRLEKVIDHTKWVIESYNNECANKADEIKLTPNTFANFLSKSS